MSSMIAGNASYAFVIAASTALLRVLRAQLTRRVSGGARESTGLGVALAVV